MRFAYSGMLAEDELKKAGWLNALTFKKFYYKPVMNDKEGNNDGSQSLISEYIVKKSEILASVMYKGIILVSVNI